MRVENGLAVLHLFGKATERLDRDAVIAAIDVTRADEGQVVTAHLLGHKADLSFMGLAPDWRTLRTLQTALARAGIEFTSSYVSVTEVSEYAKGMPEHMLQARRYPQLPPAGLDAFCFYPMSKKREGHANWYATPFAERNRMMHEHGATGRGFSGRVLQLITGSTGLDSHEWGVTLFVDAIETLKDVVYTMRFDEGSALYGDFGDFYVGYLSAPDAMF